MAHRRRNALTGEWVLVSPDRTTRPWLGAAEPAPTGARPPHDPGCHLCPGNERAGGHRMPGYVATHVFDNDFPALTPDASDAPRVGGLLEAAPEPGTCRVLCYSPRHDLDFADLDLDAASAVVDAWAAQYEELGALDRVRHVQVFENRGAAMGASNPHPHGQIWAQASVPDEVARELDRQRAHLEATGRCLLCEYAAHELADGARVVEEGDGFVAVVPFWAAWPFEALVLPTTHLGALPELPASGRRALADVLGRLVRRYDRLFDVPFPYSMGLHQRPTDGEAHPGAHLHAHLFPPLLRSATVRKFMVGYELLGEPQRDLTPEEAAARLRALPAEP